MGSKATITLILLGRIQSSLAAPARANILALRDSGSLAQGCQHTTVFSSSTSPCVLQELSGTAPSSLELKPLPISSYFSNASTKDSGNQPTRVITVTKEVPTTVTVSATPVTITETRFQAPPITRSSPPSRTSTAGLGPAKTIWLEPTDLSDLSPFRVSKFAAGEDNLEVVAADSTASGSSAGKGAASTDDGDQSALPSLLQIYYPAGSVNPGQKPLGGAEFYASPIEISNAHNVTLQYSVYFPSDFDWVLAGKLPGLYGGHTGCSGGNAALDCFSTRLMWRDGGAGELYLYAPKNKQTNNLCTSPGSFCDAAYGLSIGRGSFFWRAGDWTTIQQTVFLNTPGQQDGVFTLNVDGKRVISRKDILYRDVLMESTKSSGKGRQTKPKTTTTTRHAKLEPTTTKTATKATPTPGNDGGFLGLGPMLGGLLGPLRRSTTSDDSPNAFREVRTPSPGAIAPEVLQNQAKISKASTKSASKKVSGFESAREVNFIGIFFSTFFGGHDDKYETPRDQYIWFKDFALSYNS